MHSKLFFALLGLVSAVFFFAFLPSPAAATHCGALTTWDTSLFSCTLSGPSCDGVVSSNCIDLSDGSSVGNADRCEVIGGTYFCFSVAAADTTPPSVAVDHSPVAPTTSSSITVTTDAFDSQSTLTQVKVFVSLNGDADYADPGEQFTCASSPCTFALGSLPAGTYPYDGSATDSHGNIGFTPTGTFTVTAGVPVIGVIPSTLPFGDVVVGAFRDLSFSISNTGGGTLSGAISGLFGTPFSCVGLCSYNIPAGGNEAITIRFSPTATGPATATLSFSGGGGATRTVSGNGVTAGGVPVANFSGAPLVGPASLTVNFTDTSTPSAGKTIITWLWNFGDGNTSAIKNPSHTYTTAGTYTVTLAVEDSGGGTDSEIKSNYVIATAVGDPPPTVTMTIDSATPPLANSPVVYRATANDAEGINDIKLFHNTGVGFVLLHTCSNSPFVAGPFSCVFTFVAGYPAGTNVSYKATATEGGPSPQSADSSVVSVVVAAAGVPGAPTVDIKAGVPPGIPLVGGAVTVSDGSTVTRSWTTTNTPDSCTASGSWAGPLDPAGSSNTLLVLGAPLTFTFTITCTKAGFPVPAVDTVVVNVVAAGVEICTDGVDQDGDGAIDCADSDCSADPACGGGPVCGNGTCEAGETTASCPADCPVGGGPTTIEFKNPLGALTFTGLINNIINFLFTIAVILAPILLVVAGVIFMTAAGDPGKVKTARSMLLWTIVGFGVILISKGLVSVLKGILGI